MGGATIQCGDFEGNDKSGSPILSVLDESFSMAFGRKPKGRLAQRIAKFLGKGPTGPEALAEQAILRVKYDEEAEIRPEVAGQLLPFLKTYQASLLQQLGIENSVEEIWKHVTPSIRAKYGSARDPGWHLYCLHDLVPACEKSVSEHLPVQVIW